MDADKYVHWSGDALELGRTMMAGLERNLANAWRISRPYTCAIVPAVWGEPWDIRWMLVTPHEEVWLVDEMVDSLTVPLYFSAHCHASLFVPTFAAAAQALYEVEAMVSAVGGAMTVIRATLVAADQDIYVFGRRRRPRSWPP